MSLFSLLNISVAQTAPFNSIDTEARLINNGKTKVENNYGAQSTYCRSFVTNYDGDGYVYGKFVSSSAESSVKVKPVTCTHEYDGEYVRPYSRSCKMLIRY